MYPGMVTFRHGWNRTPPHVPRPRFDAALRAAYVPPGSVDYYSQVPVVGMHLNDKWGCCTCSACANYVQGSTFYGQGAEVQVPDQDVEQEYQQSGFNPAAGQPGDNPTDNGWLISSALAFLKSVGLQGHAIAAYGQLASVRDHSAVMTCIAEFGYASVGLPLPQSAMDQFNAGQFWNPGGNGTIIGGHCVLAAGYNATGPVVWTWGRAQQVTWAFWDAYVEEFWPVVSRDWVSAVSGKDPEGVDLVILGAEFAAVTGVNPFPPAPAPQPPAPAPAPPPAPSPEPPAPPAPPPADCTSLGRALGVLRRWRYYSD